MVDEAGRFYGDRLVSLVVFGSVGRRTCRPDSDIDVLLLVKKLPRGRTRRVAEFSKIEEKIEDELHRFRRIGIFIELSPVIKSPIEAKAGSPIFLDMVEDARILFDRDGFFAKRLEALKRRLKALGARRLWSGSAWYWDLKPDYIPGEVFEI